MDSAGFDCVVIGSGLLAGFAAGLLAEEHGQRTALVGQRWSPFTIQREVAAGAELITRPDTLSLLDGLRAEMGRIGSHLAKGVMEHGDVVFIAEAPDTIEALGHFRYLARSLNWSVEPDVDKARPAARLLRARDVPLMLPDRMEPALDAWLKRLAVTRPAPGPTRIVHKRDGSMVVVTGSDELVARHVVLADAEAVAAHAGAGLVSRSLRVAPAAAYLVDRAEGPNASVTSYLDRGVRVLTGQRGGATVIAQGEDPAARAGSTLAPGAALRSAGEARFLAVATQDGAPLVGEVRAGVSVALGLGMATPFFAPLLARMVAGGLSDREAAWLGPRGLTRATARADVVDYVAALA